MNDYRAAAAAPRYQLPEVYSSCRDPGNSTSYHGAQGNIDDRTPTIRLDKDFEGRVATTTSPTAASRWLSSLSTATAPTVTAALARSSTVLHSRAKSWATNLNTNTGASPERNRQSKIFGDLFSGQSAPVHLGVPTSPSKEDDTTEFFMEYQTKFTERPTQLRHQRRESALSTKSVATKAQKTSWFSRKASQPVETALTASDEIVNMNINNELFPHGPADPLSPQAFNDLLLNATNLLQRMQAAYKEKVEYISNIQPEIDAQKEEVEEAETRLAMYKSQLEDIGRQHEEQKEVNKELIEQLSAEKMKLSDAREAAKNTIRLVRRDTASIEDDENTDDEVHRRRKRGSAGSASDSGFESDADTASLWSAGVESQRQSRFMLSTEYADAASARAGPSSRPAFSSRASTISQQSAVYPSNPQGSGRVNAESPAWATVEQLRHENHGLKTQVEHLQYSLQDCIELIEGSSSR